MSALVQLFAVFSLLSVLAVGGGLAVLPEMKALTEVRHQWVTADQFVDFYSLGQLAPGPNMNMVLLIGWQVAGLPGALAVWVGFFLPSSLLAFWAGREWRRLAGWPWRESVRRGLAPLTVGLMVAGVISLARVALVEPRAIALGAVAAVVLTASRLNPAFVIAASSVTGWLVLR